jgi:pheromone shutdown-related protein TraB
MCAFDRDEIREMDVEHADKQEPMQTVEWRDTRITLLGTAHISRASADMVESLLASGDYDAVAIELCPSRHNAIVNPESLAKMDLFEIIREGKAVMVAANLALGAYQQRMAEQLDIEPGAEMRVALESAREHHLPVMLIDREISITLKRIYRNVSWWKRLNLFTGLVASLLTRQKVTEEEIERLKEGDLLESAFTQFAEQAQELYEPLISERDLYMAARLEQEIVQQRPRHILAVVGAGHLRGMRNHLDGINEGTNPEGTLTRLDALPKPSMLPKFIPWIIVTLIIIGFAIGFSRNTTLGWNLVIDWVVINGGLSALGALLAAAHPLTIIGAFIAAPLTSLNPTVGAGMVTAAIEIFIRRPKVADFSQIKKDTANIRGWWRNRVSRTLLIFIFSTLGSGIGTYLAGALIYKQLS